MRLFLVFVLLFSVGASANASEVDSKASYQSVELEEFARANHVSARMSKKKQRLMLKPTPVRFKAQLMSKPASGEFSLAYDALQLWGAESELPNINHSAFVGLQAGPVLGMYVTQEAADMLNGYGLNTPAMFYAMHIYNYSKGPRLVIVAVEPISNKP